MAQTNEQLAMRVSWNTIIGNVLLTAFKLYAGIVAHSAAMVSDAVESLSDVLSTFVVIIGIKRANVEPDKDHPYGHERMECVAAIILSVFLFATGIGIGFNGVKKIFAGSHDELPVPGLLALVAAVVSIAVKEWMYWYTRAAAKKVESGVLMADAWHHRSDALSSIGSFVGILGARMGFPVLDPVACVIICLFILKAAISIFMDSIGKMTDKACDDKVLAEIHRIIAAEAEVIKIDRLQTRLFGDRIYVDVEIGVDSKATLLEAHNVAQRVHDSIELHIPKVKHCMVHMNPADINNPDAHNQPLQGE